VKGFCESGVHWCSMKHPLYTSHTFHVFVITHAVQQQSQQSDQFQTDTISPPRYKLDSPGDALEWITVSVPFLERPFNANLEEALR